MYLIISKIFSNVLLYFQYWSLLQYLQIGGTIHCLLRPPQIAAMQKVFAPMISSMLDNKVQQIMFLSVQSYHNLVTRY